MPVVVLKPTGFSSPGVTDHGALTGLSDDDHAQYLLEDGTRAMSGALDMGGQQITNVGNVDGRDVSADGVVLDAHVADASIHFTEASIDHGAIAGLSDDDHAQYLLLAGRAGGQSAIGGTGAGEEIEIRGSTNANLGLIRAQSPIVFDDVSPANALSAYSIADTSTQSFAAGFIGGVFNASPSIAFSNAVFIWEGMRGAPNIQSNVSPGFAAFTLFQALPVLRAGSGTGNNPLQAFVLNGGPTTQNDYAGSRTSANTIGVGFSPQTKTTVSGAVLSVTNQTAVRFNPTFSTVSGSTANLGTLRGVHVQNPVAALFQPSAGTETLAALYGLDVNAIPFGGNVEKAAVRSALTPASNSYFLLNTGGAVSSFGAGNATWNDNAGLLLGSGGDALISYDGTDLVIDTQVVGFGRTQIPYGLEVGGDVFPVSDFVRRAASTNLILSSWRLTGLTTGNMADGFGTALFWSIEDNSAVRHNIAYQSAERAGADNTGLYRLWVYAAGAATEVWNATASLMTVTADATFNGRVDINNAVALGGGAAPTLGTIGGAGPAAAAQATWVEIDVGGVAHWIPAWT